MSARPHVPMALLGRSRRGALAAAVVLLALAPVAPALAADAGSPSGREPAYIALGLLGGPTLIDPRLADYQWDVRPRMAWGLQALAGRGRVSLGARAWRSETVQQLDLPAGPLAPAVRSTTLELLARVRVTSLAGTRLWAGVNGGRIGIDYRPEHIVVAAGGPAGTVVADLAPVHEWTAGAGLGFERTLLPHATVGIAVERRFFALDTAHRAGAAVVDRRESFGDWSARLELAWLLPLPVKRTSR